MFREGLAELLNKPPGLSVVGQCASSTEALSLIKAAQPTIVLLDFDLGAERAFDFLEKVRTSGFDGRILILTAGVTESEAVQLVQAAVGASFTNTIRRKCFATRSAGSLLEMSAWRRITSSLYSGRLTRRVRAMSSS